jgi:hypothetical protein
MAHSLKVVASEVVDVFLDTDFSRKADHENNKSHAPGPCHQLVNGLSPPLICNIASRYFVLDPVLVFVFNPLGNDLRQHTLWSEHGSDFNFRNSCIAFMVNATPF